MSSVRESLAEIRERIGSAARRAGRDPGTVTLVAVCKKQPVGRILEAYAAGQRVFGENYVQELKEMRSALEKSAEGSSWHFIGHLQSNKARLASSLADVIETVDSAELAARLDKAAREASRRLGVLIEVRLGAEGSKSGVLEADLARLVDRVSALESLSLSGLMSIPPAEGSRRWFAELRRIRDATERATGRALPELSMGMSADFEDAIEEGATIVRVGTLLFGARSG
ncbi:MAG: YggS family pyridoxal phosphate-dependent enzyme [Deltaproteobacteria bacterium]|nr:YggS family pyridoxal phosphate-dependent enzyme [Deltaproteobacteria bacterium]